jgi:guanylate kinase
LFHLLGKDESKAVILTAEYLLKNNLLDSHINFLRANNINLIPHAEWVSGLSKYNNSFKVARYAIFALLGIATAYFCWPFSLNYSLGYLLTSSLISTACAFAASGIVCLTLKFVFKVNLNFYIPGTILTLLIFVPYHPFTISAILIGFFSRLLYSKVKIAGSDLMKAYGFYFMESLFKRPVPGLALYAFTITFFLSLYSYADVGVIAAIWAYLISLNMAGSINKSNFISRDKSKDPASSKSGREMTDEEVVAEISQASGKIRELTVAEKDSFRIQAEAFRAYLNQYHPELLPLLNELLADLGHLRAGPFKELAGTIRNNLFYIDEEVLANPLKLHFTILHELGAKQGLTHEQNIALEKESNSQKFQEVMVIIGPSGSGKTTLIKHLLKNGNFLFPRLSTTRKPRHGETPDEDRIFVDEAIFERKSRAGEYIMARESHGYRYGLDKGELARCRQEGKVLILDTTSLSSLGLIKREFPEAKTVLILPFVLDGAKNMSDSEIKGLLRERIVNRSEITEEELNKRLNEGVENIRKFGEAAFDKIIVSGPIEKMEEDIKALFKKEAVTVAKLPKIDPTAT